MEKKMSFGFILNKFFYWIIPVVEDHNVNQINKLI